VHVVLGYVMPLLKDLIGLSFASFCVVLVVDW
jgi:hypothetical protein